LLVLKLMETESVNWMKSGIMIALAGLRPVEQKLCSRDAMKASSIRGIEFGDVCDSVLVVARRGETVEQS
jgi:hypothetical protein